MLVRAGDYVELMKPSVMSLAVFTALVGLLSAPATVRPVSGLVAIICIAAGAGAAATLNMWYDADIDAIMSRTAHRPIPQGRVRPKQALAFGLTLAAGSVALLALLINLSAATLLALAIAFYVLVYTAWLKRSSPQNIVVGGAAGAIPPMIGWAAASDGWSAEPVLLFLIIFLWTPPHFWALSLYRIDDYARAGVPMLPVVAGRTKTRRQILLYTLLLVPTSLLPWAAGFVGATYGVFATLAGGRIILLAWRLQTEDTKRERAAKRLFAFSIAYLFALFAMLLLDKELSACSVLKTALSCGHQLHLSG
jgi:protoheme IX farnesyltransferase